MVVLGAEEATDNGRLEIDFFEYNNNAAPTTEDSFGNTGQSFDRLCTLQYGNIVRAD
jgi:hypothetical protein